jgi:bifunctional UDP-N-acetylglucosamine pyrophosphorylase/glucosamine-1-phosphate N-acetyltransferase
MAEVRALIAAAGSGSRAGLPYPKTLHPVLGRPILLRLLDILRPIDTRPTVIVSPSGRGPIAQCLGEGGYQADLVEQAEPTGMGDAVLCFQAAPAFAQAEHVLLVWGDLPLLEQATIATLLAVHIAHGNDFTFATRLVDKAYTLVERDGAGRVLSLIETREAGIEPRPGERDVGLFVFRRDVVFDLLAQRLPGAVGGATGENGFLYIVSHRLSDLDGVDQSVGSR